MIPLITVNEIDDEIQKVLKHGNNRQDLSYLADLFICKIGIQGKDEKSIANSTVIKTNNNGSKFYACVNGKCYDDVLAVMNELMEVLQVTNPRLYAGVMRKIND